MVVMNLIFTILLMASIRISTSGFVPNTGLLGCVLDAVDDWELPMLIDRPTATMPISCVLSMDEDDVCLEMDSECELSPVDDVRKIGASGSIDSSSLVAGLSNDGVGLLINSCSGISSLFFFSILPSNLKNHSLMFSCGALLRYSWTVTS